MPAKKELQQETYEFDYNRVPELKSNWEAFWTYIHNPAEGTYCNHTGKKWAITGMFYTCFFTVLALLFAICMKGLMASLNYEKPRWILEESLIGTNPALYKTVTGNNLEDISKLLHKST